MDAPKRIWTDWRAANDASVAFDHPPENDGEGYRTKYILAAEHERIVADKDARIAELEAVRIRMLNEKLSGDWTTDARDDALEDAAMCCEAEADKCDDAVKWNGPGRYARDCKAAAYAMRDRAAAIRALKKK